jgi:hypothetical protein
MICRSGGSSGRKIPLFGKSPSKKSIANSTPWNLLESSDFFHYLGTPMLNSVPLPQCNEGLSMQLLRQWATLGLTNVDIFFNRLGIPPGFTLRGGQG